MTQPTAGTQFTTNAENTSVLIDLKQPENEQHRAAALALLHTRHPEYAPGSETEEDLSDQYAHPGGYVHAALNTQTGKVEGLVTGIAYPTQTAAITYAVYENDDAAATAGMIRQTQTALAAQGVKAIVVEQEENETAQWDVMRAAGFVRAPIENYRQILTAGDDSEVKGLVPIVAFAERFTPEERSALTLAHFKAFQEQYDPENKQPRNAETLAAFEKNLSHAGANFGWNMAVGGVGAPRPAEA